MTPLYVRHDYGQELGDPRAFYTTRVATSCDNCRGINVGVVYDEYRYAGTPSGAYAGADLQAAKELLEDDRVEHFAWFPKKALSPKFPDVPKHVARAATEAHEAASIGANIAAILMARTVIEATAKTHGIVDGQLWKKIDALKDAQLIRPSAAEAAHEIRHLGNDMAHGDLADLPTEQDAADVLTLMDLILNEVFQATALTAAIKARRTAPKEA